MKCSRAQSVVSNYMISLAASVVYLSSGSTSVVIEHVVFKNLAASGVAIFPAHIKHLVEINQSDEDRISIAMDLTIHV